MIKIRMLVVAAALFVAPVALEAAPPVSRDGLKQQAVERVAARAKLAQEVNDSIFSFGELGFQEFETSRYLTELLEKNGFSVERGVAGIPTAWVARWTYGSGGPVIALGSDIDAIPRASQKPGIPWREPLVEGAPGHGEGHNSGQAVNLVAALAVKELMQQHGIAGTLMLWPGAAEELVAAKAYMVRDGLFRDVDAVLFSHVGHNLTTYWGRMNGTGLVSVEYTFEGESAHAAGRPWLGHSALDGVELMNIGWNFRREHLRPEQRSHYVITGGGDQPNVVPSKASVWYYFREIDFEGVAELYRTGNEIAEAAAKMSGTRLSTRLLGTAAPRHFNRPIAEAAYANMQRVGLPAWSEDEQAFARVVQKNAGATRQDGLATELAELSSPPDEPKSGGSDDIGDVAWIVPTAMISYPANIPGLPGHSWTDAIAMATPIAHKGVVAGAKVMAMTTIDLLLDGDLRRAARDYFRTVQTKDQAYVPMLGTDDRPPVELNTEIMARFRPDMRKYYYDADRFPTYLDQLGIRFPVLEPTSGNK